MSDRTTLTAIAPDRLTRPCSEEKGYGSDEVDLKAVDIGEEEEIVRVNHGSSDCRQSIIVSKLDLADGDGVILVDNGDDA